MKLSVILPAKKEAQGLRRTLPVLRAQVPDAEIIVSDDGSTDDTAQVAAEHGARVVSVLFVAQPDRYWLTVGGGSVQSVAGAQLVQRPIQYQASSYSRDSSKVLQCSCCCIHLGWSAWKTKLLN